MSHTDGRETYVRNGIAIINPYGGIWTGEIFQTPEEAHAYLTQFWKNTSNDLSRFKLAIATQTITLDRTPGDPVFIDLPKS